MEHRLGFPRNMFQHSHLTYLETCTHQLGEGITAGLYLGRHGKEEFWRNSNLLQGLNFLADVF